MARREKSEAMTGRREEASGRRDDQHDMGGGDGRRRGGRDQQQQQQQRGQGRSDKVGEVGAKGGIKPTEGHKGLESRHEDHGHLVAREQQLRKEKEAREAEVRRSSDGMRARLREAALKAQAQANSSVPSEQARPQTFRPQSGMFSSLANLLPSLLSPGLAHMLGQQARTRAPQQQFQRYLQREHQGSHAEGQPEGHPHGLAPGRASEARKSQPARKSSNPRKSGAAEKGVKARQAKGSTSNGSPRARNARETTRTEEPKRGRLRALERNQYIIELWLEGNLNSVMTRRAVQFAASSIESILKKARRGSTNQPSEDEIISHLLAMLAAGGEFTHQHSVRVMELALGLCDELGVDDPEIRRQVQLGALFKDIGEHDYLLGRTSPGFQNQLAGWLNADDMWSAGVLHDIGKLKIPEEILYKPGKLTQEEFEIIKMHPVYGEQILYRFPPLRKLCPAVRGHHERWDGKGYPDGLEGDDIPMSARIIALADVFDALFADRPYRSGMPFEKVVKIIEEGAGTHFDPLMVPAFLRAVQKLHRRGILSGQDPEAEEVGAGH